MRLTLELDQSSNGTWVVIGGPVHERLAALLRVGIRKSCRNFDGKRWSVHYSQLELLVGVARPLYEHVDWSSLPPAMQVLACGGQVPIPSLPTEDPYAILHLLPTAPVAVVRAAYRALALEAHPDHGGTDEAMTRLSSALAAILERKK